MKNNIFTNKNLLSFVSVIFLFLIAFSGYNIERTNFILLFLFYIASFVCYLIFVKNKHLEFKDLFFLAIAARIILIFSIPKLSNDFYRFLWDGNLITNGMNPYLHTPLDIMRFNMTEFPVIDELFVGMSGLSKENYTCYPPLNELICSIPPILAPKNMLYQLVWLRIIIILAEIGTIYLFRQILTKLKRSGESVIIYALNPLVILEITGNLHFEGIMLFFLLFAFYLFLERKYILSAILFASAVSIKLIPLIFLPVLFRKLPFRKSVAYFLIVELVIVIFFLPFNPLKIFPNFFESLQLYFLNFEFNASLFYIARAIGFSVKGYDIIQVVGKITPFIVFSLVIILSLRRRNLLYEGMFESMMFAILIYYLFASVVHPWYIIVPLAISVFTKLRFVVIWSLLIILSYFAYHRDGFNENMLFIALEYSLTILFMLLEFIRRKALPVF